MLAISGILDQLEHFPFGSHGEIPCIFGDPASPLEAHLQTPFRRGNLTLLQKSLNKEISSARVSLEWVFGVFTSR